MSAALARGYILILSIILLFVAFAMTSPIGQSIVIMLPDALLYLLVVPILLGAETSGFGTDAATASVFVILNLVVMLSFIFAATSITKTNRAISGQQNFSRKTSLVFQLSYPLAIASSFYLIDYMDGAESANFALVIIPFILVSLICLPIYIYSKNRVG